MAEKLSPDQIDKVMGAAIMQLKAMGGRAKGKDVLAAIEPKLRLTDHEKDKIHTGAVCWDTHIRLYIGLRKDPMLRPGGTIPDIRRERQQW